MSSTKRKAPPVRIARPQTTQSAKPSVKPRVNEANTSVTTVSKLQQQLKKKSGSEAIEISSDESDNDSAGGDDDDLMDEDEIEAEADQQEQPQTNGHAATPSKAAALNGKTTVAEDDDDDDASAGEDEDHEPTFGDLVREHETVDVAAALDLLRPADAAAINGTDATGGAVVKSGAAAPTLASLGHLLNAALRSGDDANLEVCFNTTTDATWMRNTIQRLDPALAGTLLQKLAARIHRRPGRAHTLIGWVQWTLITHGGALLASQPGVTRALQELHRVLEERARGLNSLLLLKGKLDMLEAQMQMRRMQRAGGGGAGVTSTVGGRIGSRAVDSANGVGRGRGAGRRRNNGGLARARGGAEEVDEEDFVTTYHEGRDDDDDDDDEDEEEDEAGQILVNGASVAASEAFVADSEEEALDEDDEDDSEDDEDEEAGDEEDDVEEMDDDELAEEDEVDFDDVDEDDEDDDDDDEEDQATAAPPPAKMQKKSGGAFTKRR